MVIFYEIIASEQLSSTFDKVSIIRFLLVDVGIEELDELTDRLDRTPLLFACQIGCDLELIKTFIELGSGSSVKTQDRNGMNALFTYVNSACLSANDSVAASNLEVVQYLLDAGADIDVQSTSEDSVMETAARRGLWKIVRFLEQQYRRKLSELQSRFTSSVVAVDSHV